MKLLNRILYRNKELKPEVVIFEDVEIDEPINVNRLENCTYMTTWSANSKSWTGREYICTVQDINGKKAEGRGSTATDAFEDANRNYRRYKWIRG